MSRPLRAIRSQTSVFDNKLHYIHIRSAHCCLTNINHCTFLPKGDDQESRKTTDYAVSKMAMPANKYLGNGIRYTLFDKDIALIKLKDKVPSSVPRIMLYGHWKKAHMRSCKVAGNTYRRSMIYFQLINLHKII